MRRFLPIGVAALFFSAHVLAASPGPPPALPGSGGGVSIGTAPGTARDAAAAIAAENAAMAKATAAIPATTMGQPNGPAAMDSAGTLDGQLIAPPNGFTRSLSARAADVFNVMDYGASGIGSVVAIGTKYGASLAAMAAYVDPIGGGTPFSWLTNPSYGYQFPLTSSAAGAADGGNLDLLFVDSPANQPGWAAQTAIWNDPAYASYRPVVGELVSDISTGTGHPCITAGSAITAVQTYPWRAIDLVPGISDWAGATAYALNTLVESGGGIWKVTTAGTSAASVPVTAPGGITVANSNGPHYSGYYNSNPATNGPGYVYTDPNGVAYTLITKVEYQQLPTGRVTIAGNSTASCPSGTVFQVTISPAQLQAISTDTIAAQTAIALANANPRGGTIYHPTTANGYAWNWPVYNQTAAGVYTPSEPYQIVFRGDGEKQTRINITADYGYLGCALGESNRSLSAASYSIYERFALFHTIGAGVTPVFGTAPVATTALCVGETALVDRYEAHGFYAGLGFARDHQHFANFDLGNNGYAFWAMPYSESFGNQSFKDGGAVAEGIASYGIASTAQINGGRCDNVHQGGAPFIYHSMPQEPNVTTPYSGTWSGMQSDSCYQEFVGEAIFEGSGSYAQVDGNIFTMNGGNAIGNTSYQRPNGAGGTVPLTVAWNLPAGDFSFNLFNANDMGAFTATAPGYSGVTAAIISSRTCGGNQFLNDQSIINGLNGVNPPTVSQAVFNCSFPGSTFNSADFSGNHYEFHPVASNTAGLGGSSVFATRGIAVFQNGNNGDTMEPVYVDGKVIFGITAQACAEGILCPVQTRGVVPNLQAGGGPFNQGTPAGLTVNGATVFAHALVTAMLDATNAIGSINGYCTTSCTVQLGSIGGAQSVATVAAAGTTQATATVLSSRVNLVTSGTGGVTLPTAGVTGDGVTIVNRTGAAINVYPQLTGTIGLLAANASYSLPAGATLTFYRSGLVAYG